MAITKVKYKDKIFPISYKIVNPSASSSILFLHGWGSNKEIMEQAFKDKDTKLIFVDMPGFGQSVNEDTILTTKDYANIISLFLEQTNQNPNIIAGHSFGGKVATLLNPKCLVLLSSAGILVPKPLGVRLKIALFKALKPFGGAKLRKIFVSNDAKEMNEAMYETFKNVVDEDFKEEFKKYRGKALLFWGEDDSATPLWTAKEINRLISNSKLYPLKGDHYFFLQHGKYILEKIKSECKDINGDIN